MPQAQQPAASLVVFIFILWLLLPDGDYPNQALLLSDLATERLARYHDALDELNQTRWGDFAPFPGSGGADSEEAQPGRFVNLTGFREVDGFAWEDLDRFRDRGLQLSRYAVPTTQDHSWDTANGEALWANASGTLRGEWTWRPGSVSKSYASYNLSHSVPSMRWIADDFDWARNITGATGRITLRLDENKTLETYDQLPADQAPLSGGSIRSIKGFTTVEDTTGSGLSWEMGLYGVHWPRQGVVLLTTTSEKFEGIFGLPHLAPGPDFFQSSQRLLNLTLAHGLAKKERNLYTDQSAPWSSDLENPLYTRVPAPHCEYVMYAQIQPPTGQDLGWGTLESQQPDRKASAINAIESELETPMGAPIGKVPDIQMSTVIWSPDCAFFLESKGPPDFPPTEGRHLSGMKREIHVHTITSWVLVFACIMFAQGTLMKNQMRESSTPSTIGRISFGTVSIMFFIDCMILVASATWTASASSTQLPTLTLMFTAFVAVMYDCTFLNKVHDVQYPESLTTRRNSPRANAARAASDRSTSGATTASPSPNPTAAGGTSLLPTHNTTRPTAAPPPSDPIIVPSDQDVDAEIADAAATTAARVDPQVATARSFQAVLLRNFFMVLVLGFLGISSLTWYPSFRNVFMNACAAAYLSLWLPQIYRNTMRNCRRALAWRFVIGQSVLRLLPVAYFWLKEDNIIYARPDRRAFAALVAWVWFQIFLLASQDVVGPRYGIPAGWTPEAWDYHPVLREDNIEAGGLPIGLVAEDNPGLERADTGVSSSQERATVDSKRRTPYVIDCAICRETLEVPVVKAGEDDTSVAGAFARRIYMVTPCRHIFHSTCLEGWMRFRLQCPICREELPPV